LIQSFISEIFSFAQDKVSVILSASGSFFEKISNHFFMVLTFSLNTSIHNNFPKLSARTGFTKIKIIYNIQIKIINQKSFFIFFILLVLIK
jgi:hypothetical protein